MAQTENPVIEVAPGRLTARGAATRARIVDAAADLMYAQGALRTSLDEVMAASRTSKSQLYHYFHDKDALIRAVIVRQTERVLDGQHPYLCALDSMTGLRRWCTMIIDVQQQRSGVGGCPIGSLASELSDTSEDARQLLADSFQNGRRAWKQACRPCSTPANSRPTPTPPTSHQPSWPPCKADCC